MIHYRKLSDVVQFILQFSFKTHAHRNTPASKRGLTLRFTLYSSMYGPQTVIIVHQLLMRHCCVYAEPSIVGTQPVSYTSSTSPKVSILLDNGYTSSGQDFSIISRSSDS